MVYPTLFLNNLYTLYSFCFLVIFLKFYECFLSEAHFFRAVYYINFFIHFIRIIGICINIIYFCIKFMKGKWPTKELKIKIGILTKEWLTDDLFAYYVKEMNFDKKKAEFSSRNMDISNIRIKLSFLNTSLSIQLFFFFNNYIKFNLSILFKVFSLLYRRHKIDIWVQCKWIRVPICLQ